MRPPSSPPCLMHELEQERASPPWKEVREWRKQNRIRLIEQRAAIEPDARRERGAQAKARLLERLDLDVGSVLGIYWPIRGEIDVRDIARRHLAAGGRVALPVVVEKGSALEFWQWYPGISMKRGVWNIPIPAERKQLIPDVLIVPLVGFDRENYRLGYGGGYYDRTLAAAARRPVCIGLGFAEGELPTIHPQPHDIPMSRIVTG